MSERPLLDFTGSAVLIAGGGQGMGESTALVLARCGCDIVVVDIDKGRAEGVADKVRSFGVRAGAIVYDLVSSNDHGDLITEASAYFPHLDGLVTIVGAAGWQPILKTSMADWEQGLRLNLGYVFSLSKSFAARLVQLGGRGSIVCVSSVSGLQAAPQHAVYGAAKAGMMSLTKTMAVEWAQYRIRVNSVAPGTIVTPRRSETPERAEQIRNSRIPMRRRGRTEDIANAVTFLLSDMAEYITGQTLAVDGGWMAANTLVEAEVGDGGADWIAPKRADLG